MCSTLYVTLKRTALRTDVESKCTVCMWNEVAGVRVREEVLLPFSLSLLLVFLKEMQRHYAAMIIRERMKQARITGMM